MGRIVTLIAALFVCGAGHAQAQPPDHRGFVQGIGGVTFGTEPSRIAGGGVGFAISPRVHLTVEGGWMGDVLPRSIRRDVDQLMREATDDLGVSVRAEVKAPAAYWATGVRLRLAEGQRVIPFLSLTAGTARIDPDIAIVVDGMRLTLDREMKEEVDLRAESRPLMGLGAGIELLAARRLGLEFGYEYKRIFTRDPAVNTHRLVAGLNVKF
jgi:opacity protein-like surface antigen